MSKVCLTPPRQTPLSTQAPSPRPHLAEPQTCRGCWLKTVTAVTRVSFPTDSELAQRRQLGGLQRSGGAGVHGGRLPGGREGGHCFVLCKDKTNGLHRLGEEDERRADASEAALADCWQSGLPKQEQAVGKSHSSLQRY